ncbi:MAG: spore coat protein [Firmicutes bacterium]|nr:spore coat protein [Bacillota bacterium]
MEMDERAVLRDCLDTLKHASACYLQASLEADSDELGRTLGRLALDKSEEKTAVFNLMHQAGFYKTRPAEMEAVQELKQDLHRLLARIGASTAANRERGLPAGRSEQHPYS